MQRFHELSVCASISLVTGPSPQMRLPMTTSPLPRRLFFGFLAFSCVLLTSCRMLGTAASVGMIKLRFGCLVEGTPIDTPTGPVAVENLNTGDLVIGYEGTPVVIQQVHQYQLARA